MSESITTSTAKPRRRKPQVIRDEYEGTDLDSCDDRDRCRSLAGCRTLVGTVMRTRPGASSWRTRVLLRGGTVSAARLTSTRRRPRSVARSRSKPKRGNPAMPEPTSPDCPQECTEHRTCCRRRADRLRLELRLLRRDGLAKYLRLRRGVKRFNRAVDRMRKEDGYDD
jgi:hypothetical protein